MKKITEVTRRDIIDQICNGFPASESHDPKYRMTYYGRLDEISFLSRLYALDKMPSIDTGYSTVEEEIRSHTMSKDDWAYGWVFSDARFGLLYGDDELFLKFLCEMFHPIVRKEQEPWKQFLVSFNELLKQDGYEIVEKSQISGRTVYGFQNAMPNKISVPVSTFQTYQLQLIGVGSYAYVFKYKDMHYDTTFVMKRAKNDLTPEELDRFRQEFTQMKALSSPYIVDVYSYNDSMNEYIREYMDCTLEKYINTQKEKLPFSQRKLIALQMLKAFKYIHSKEILHGDVTPKNILLKLYEDTCVVKIADFGLIKIPTTDFSSASCEYKGEYNDPALRREGYDTYNILHETYAITKLIEFTMTGTTTIDDVENAALKAFIEKGISSDKNNRYQNITELMAAFNQVKE